MELCVLCLDGLEPSLVPGSNLVLEYTGETYSPSASSLIAWRKFANHKKHGTWWNNWRQTVVIDLPVNRTHLTDNIIGETIGGMLFDGPPNDADAIDLMAKLQYEAAAHCSRLAEACAETDAEVLIAYLGISDTMGHTYLTWKPDVLREAYKMVDNMAAQIWSACRPKKRVVLSDHGMRPITKWHVGWHECTLLKEKAFTKRIEDGRHVVQTGQHWKITPGFFSSDFLPGSHSLRKLGGILRSSL